MISKPGFRAQASHRERGCPGGAAGGPSQCAHFSLAFKASLQSSSREPSLRVRLSWSRHLTTFQSSVLPPAPGRVSPLSRCHVQRSLPPTLKHPYCTCTLSHLLLGFSTRTPALQGLGSCLDRTWRRVDAPNKHLNEEINALSPYLKSNVLKGNLSLLRDVANSPILPCINTNTQSHPGPQRRVTLRWPALLGVVSHQLVLGTHSD